MNGLEASWAMIKREAIPGVKIILEAGGSFAAWEGVQAVRTIHPVRTPEDQGNAAMTSILEDVDGTEPVVGNVEERIRIAGDDRWLRAGIANQLNAYRKIPEVFRIAHVAMEKGDAIAREDRNISFAAAANEIVDDGNPVPCAAEMKSDMGTDKAATTGDKDVQEMILLQGL